MKIEHHNYCRQFGRQFLDRLRSTGTSDELKRRYSAALDLAHMSKKFSLPERGYLLHDDNLRGLEGLTTWKLPFDCVALEYWMPLSAPRGVGYVSTKRVVFARQWGEEIAVDSVHLSDHDGVWHPMVEETVFVGPQNLRWRPDGSAEYTHRQNDGGDLLVFNDMRPEVNVALSFINALSCSNVKVERSDPSKKAKKPKDALPFDSYHFLTIDVGRQPGESGPGLLTSHRSPREHIRRGHIRRYQSGIRVWVNSHVVAAGQGAGKITKDYGITNSKLVAGVA